MTHALYVAAAALLAAFAVLFATIGFTHVHRTSCIRFVASSASAKRVDGRIIANPPHRTAGCATERK